jgi:hypothetical protein
VFRASRSRGKPCVPGRSRHFPSPRMGAPLRKEDGLAVSWTDDSRNSTAGGRFGRNLQRTGAPAAVRTPSHTGCEWARSLHELFLFAHPPLVLACEPQKIASRALLGLSRYVGRGRARLAWPLSRRRRITGRWGPVSRLLVLLEIACLRLIAVLFAVLVRAVHGIRHELASSPARRNANEAYRPLAAVRSAESVPVFVGPPTKLRGGQRVLRWASSYRRSVLGAFRNVRSEVSTRKPKTRDYA